VDKSVNSCNVLYLFGLTCIPDDIFLTRRPYSWIDLLHFTPHKHHRLPKEATPETYMQKIRFPQKHHLKSRTIHTQRCTHFWRFILKSTSIKTLLPVRTIQSETPCLKTQQASPYTYITLISLQTGFQAKHRSITISTLSQDWWWVHTASQVPNLPHPR